MMLGIHGNNYNYVFCQAQMSLSGNQLTMKSLLSLYQSVIIPILSEWLFDYDLCRLDSAVCCRQLRPGFLQRLKDLRLFNIKEIIETIDFYEWVDLRQLKYLICKLNVNSFECKRFHSHLSRVRHFEHIETSCLTSLSRLVSLGVTVGSLTVNKCEDTNVTVGNLDCVVSLDIGHNYCTNFSSLIVCCRNLQVLKTNKSLDISGAFDLPNIQRVEGVNPAILGLPMGAEQVDLVRTFEQSSKSPILIGDKTFYVVKLGLNSVKEEDLIVWSPLLGHLHTLSVCNNSMLILDCVSHHCFCLTSLTCHYCEFDEDTLISVFKQSPLLVSIWFRRCQNNTNRTLDALAQYCLKLERLTIYGLHIDEKAVVNVLQCCKHLKELSFGRWLRTEGILRHLAISLSSLTLSYRDSWQLKFNESKDELEMCSRRVSGYFNVPRLLSNNPNLTTVDLSEMCHFTDYKLKQLVNCCSLLSTITLKCLPVTTEGLLHLVKCKNLTSLSLLHFRDNVSDDFIHDLLVNRPHLSKLSLYQCGGFTGAVLPMIGLLCPKIRCVEVPYCQVDIQSSDVIALLKMCTSLDVLILTSMSLVDTTILPFLPPKMRFLDLLHTSIIQADMDAHIAATEFRCSKIVLSAVQYKQKSYF